MGNNARLVPILRHSSLRHVKKIRCFKNLARTLPTIGRHASHYKTRWLRCIGHIINLVIRAFISIDNAEAAEIAYSRAELSQLDKWLDNGGHQ